MAIIYSYISRDERFRRYILYIALISAVYWKCRLRISCCEWNESDIKANMKCACRDQYTVRICLIYRLKRITRVECFSLYIRLILTLYRSRHAHKIFVFISLSFHPYFGRNERIWRDLKLSSTYSPVDARARQIPTRNNNITTRIWIKFEFRCYCINCVLQKQQVCMYMPKGGPYYC